MLVLVGGSTPSRVATHQTNNLHLINASPGHADIVEGNAVVGSQTERPTLAPRAGAARYCGCSAECVYTCNAGKQPALSCCSSPVGAGATACRDAGELAAPAVTGKGLRFGNRRLGQGLNRAGRPRAGQKPNRAITDLSAQTEPKRLKDAAFTYRA